MAQLISTHPSFLVADVGETMRLYEKYLGFHGDPFPEAEPYAFAILFRDHVEIMLQRLEGYEKPNLYRLRADLGVWDAYIRMSGIQEFYDSVRERVEVISPLVKRFYQQWEFEVKDPNGYVLVFSEAIEGD
jgi:hypothetical protein